MNVLCQPASIASWENLTDPVRNRGSAMTVTRWASNVACLVEYRFSGQDGNSSFMLAPRALACDWAVSPSQCLSLGLGLSYRGSLGMAAMGVGQGRWILG